MQHRVDQAESLALRMKDACLGSRIDRLHRQVTRIFENELRPLRLSLQQLQVLTLLVLLERPVRPTEVASLLSLERSTVSRNLALLGERGYVEAAERTEAGRLAAVTISSSGRKALAAADGAWSRAQATASAALGADAPEVIDRLLAGIAG